MEKDDFTIDAETAEREFDNWADAMDLDLDTSDMDAEDLTAFNKQKRRLIRAIRRGSLIFNDEGEAIYTPQHKKSTSHDALTFHEGSGASLMAMDGKKKNQNVAKTYAVMGNICKVPPKTLAGLFGEDQKVSGALFALLMD